MDTNKMFLEKVVDIFNTGDLSEVDNLFADNYIDHQKPEYIKVDGAEEFKQVVTGARKSLNNLHVSIIHQSSDDNMITGRLNWKGLNANGQNVERETTDTLRIENNKVVEHWGVEEWSKTS